MTSPGLSHAHWRKSTYSNASGNCVEVAVMAAAGAEAASGRARARPGTVAVRDSKDPDAREVRFHADEWKSFLGG
jgi:Domain of unknown function (DUF397)